MTHSEPGHSASLAHGVPSSSQVPGPKRGIRTGPTPSWRRVEKSKRAGPHSPAQSSSPRQIGAAGRPPQVLAAQTPSGQSSQSGARQSIVATAVARGQSAAAPSEPQDRARRVGGAEQGQARRSAHVELRFEQRRQQSAAQRQRAQEATARQANGFSRAGKCLDAGACPHQTCERDAFAEQNAAPVHRQKQVAFRVDRHAHLGGPARAFRAERRAEVAKIVRWWQRREVRDELVRRRIAVACRRVETVDAGERVADSAAVARGEPAGKRTIGRGHRDRDRAGKAASVIVRRQQGVGVGKAEAKRSVRAGLKHIEDVRASRQEAAATDGRLAQAARRSSSAAQSAARTTTLLVPLGGRKTNVTTWSPASSPKPGEAAQPPARLTVTKSFGPANGRSTLPWALRNDSTAPGIWSQLACANRDEATIRSKHAAKQMQQGAVPVLGPPNTDVLVRASRGLAQPDSCVACVDSLG